MTNLSFLETIPTRPAFSRNLLARLAKEMSVYLLTSLAIDRALHKYQSDTGIPAKWESLPAVIKELDAAVSKLILCDDIESTKAAIEAGFDVMRLRKAETEKIEPNLDERTAPVQGRIDSIREVLHLFTERYERLINAAPDLRDEISNDSKMKVV